MRFCLSNNIPNWAGWPHGSGARGGHIFDVSLHGFPVGMIKSCRRYWSQEIADRIVQLKNIRFDNPMFSLTTTFNRDDFSKLLIEKFQIEEGQVKAFFDKARSMSHLDDDQMTAGELFEQFFPGREDVVRLLMEPITYANGSTLEDPALTYGIVFSNFMSKGVFTFQGGTDQLIKLMRDELNKNGGRYLPPGRRRKNRGPRRQSRVGHGQRAKNRHTVGCVQRQFTIDDF